MAGRGVPKPDRRVDNDQMRFNVKYGKPRAQSTERANFREFDAFALKRGDECRERPGNRDGRGTAGLGPARILFPTGQMGRDNVVDGGPHERLPRSLDPDRGVSTHFVRDFSGRQRPV